jgi:hypothetical protein
VITRLTASVRTVSAKAPRGGVARQILRLERTVNTEPTICESALRVDLRRLSMILVLELMVSVSCEKCGTFTTQV